MPQPLKHNMHGPNVGVTLGRTASVGFMIFYGLKMDWGGLALMFFIFCILGVFKSED